MSYPGKRHAVAFLPMQEVVEGFQAVRDPSAARFVVQGDGLVFFNPDTRGCELTEKACEEHDLDDQGKCP